MSHQKERKEKNCLNCGAEVQGLYCHLCGQANVETHETLWGLITHFVYDVTHFDGKFFSTLRFLLFRPGFLSAEYQRGRRSSYLHPIKMYVFTSALFFFVIFSLKGTDKVIQLKEHDLLAQKVKLQQQLSETEDPARQQSLKDSIYKLDQSIVLLEYVNAVPKDPTISDTLRSKLIREVENGDNGMNILGLGKLPNTVADYEKQQQLKPENEQHNWLQKKMAHQLIQLRIKFLKDGSGYLKEVSNSFVHALPKMLIVSMPFMALMLSLLYFRQRQTNIVSHIVLVLHGYIAVYILILFILLFNWLAQILHLSIFNWIAFAVGLYGVYYQYRSLRNYFKQGKGKTIFKFSMLLLFTFVLFALLASIFVINSMIQTA